MSKNINSFIKKNQQKLLTAIGIALVVVVTSIYYINKKMTEDATVQSEPQYEDESIIEPNLTGAVQNTFNSRVDSQVLTDSQTVARESQQAVKELTKEFQGLKTHLDKKDREINTLKQKIEELEKGNHTNSTTNQSQQPATNNDSSTIERIGEGQYGISGRQVSYSAPKPIQGLLETQNFTYSQKETKKKEKYYIPSGAFSNAIVLEGVDANAAVTAKETDMSPMQFKLTGLLHLPQNKKLDKFNGCFVTAGAYGDISSERAIPRLQRLSCVINDKHIDMAVKGHVSFYGKNGIKGTPVMRNGQVLGLAFTSGALGSIGSAVSQIGSTSVGIGAEHTISAGEVAQQAAGKGVQSAANKLADYYIALAEQYHPIIPIGAANRVEVVFQEGFWAEFLEDQESEDEIQPEVNKQASQEYQDNSDLPPELVNQLGAITNGNLGEFVAPNNKSQ
ncbi:TrbI/VirB10 family protein [Xenorhabdus ishibashii]|uniref:Conjugal transfer protein TraB n=1 Tax=Xenorhabdus ishibashii TaxID=1034471 RepID=A0A2D0K7Y4_9GAMM|nr:TrbI/VirB10 family protein [Xenorhabdus ishibashii]PHM59554.1 conjugal transfer protein TraB [Xenorhabdus ishibashii]